MSSKQSPPDDAQRLRRLMRDVVGLSTLPATWTAYGPERIAHSLAEVLVRILELHWLYVHLPGDQDQESVEAVHGREGPVVSQRVPAMAAALRPWLADEVTDSAASIDDPLGQGRLRLALTRFDCGGGHGTLIAGARRSDFPDETADLLLGLGANQIAVVLQRKRVERSLREERERAATTLASIGDGVISTNGAGCVSFLNPVAEQLTGWTDEEAKDLPLTAIFNIVNHHTRLPVENPAVRALREGRIVGLANHTILIARDGTERAIDDSAAPIRDGKQLVMGAVLVFRDVSERIRAQVDQARLAAIVESSEDAIVSKTLDGTIKSWNAGAERLFGYAAEEAIGRRITMIIPPERHGEEAKIMQRLMRGERVEHFDTVRMTKDGRRVDISLTISPIRDAEGEVIGASKVARDITERLRSEALLREADRKKDEFLALLAHELRNPLAPLQNGLQILRMSGGKPGVESQALDMMQRQLTFLVRLVDDLLEVCRVNQGKLDLRRSTVLLKDALDSAVEIARPAILKAGQRLTVSLPPEPIYVLADVTRLSQVFGNLLTNSAKYTSKGGNIRIAVEREGGQVLVSVIDDGIGLPADALTRIFEMFTQVNPRTEKSLGGLGIGLALAKGLVEMHGGTVTAESEGPGKGSTFRVRLPVLSGAASQAGAAQDERASPPRNQDRRILVVDDNRDAAKSMTLLLEMVGNEVHMAHDGLEAVEKAELLRPHVVLMDVGMPRLNGYEATRRIRKQPWGTEMIIVALTGWGQEVDRTESKAAGCDAHLVKPVTVNDLERLLMELQGESPPA